MQLQIDKLGKVAVTVEEDYWSIQKDYDRLTIVEKEGIFGTFISRKPVPAGTELTNRTYWIPFSSLKEEVVIKFAELVNDLNNLELTLAQKEAEIYKAMASLTAGGLVLKQTFGDSEVVGISQKAITERVDYLQDQIDKLHPGTLGIIITTTPNVIYKGVDTNVTITASMANRSIADSIKIYVDNLVVAEGHNVSEFSTTEILNETKTIKVEAEQDGFTYDNNIKVMGVEPYYVGGGDVYTDIIQDEYKQSINVSPAGTYIITTETDESYVFFVVPESMVINKATMNGFDFPLDSPQDVTIDDKSYKVYRSSNTYDAGILTIIIS